MTKEIKEILEFLKPIENRTCATLGSKKCELLLDYITNLQQDLANYVNVVLHDRKVIDDYKSRCEKAIEYVENMSALLWNEAHKYNYDFDYLLNILQNGSEDNEC